MSGPTVDVQILHLVRARLARLESVSGADAREALEALQAREQVATLAHPYADLAGPVDLEPCLFLLAQELRTLARDVDGDTSKDVDRFDALNRAVTRLEALADLARFLDVATAIALDQADGEREEAAE